MITIDSLSKKYGGHTVVHDISFTARNGRVTGFLGPNGAGKSTSMRMMVGLTTPTEGTATISGRHFADLPNPGREAGVMLDASAQHAGRTGREILTIAQQIMDVPARRVTELLDLVSLAATEADRRVGNYSLGMRQRLGIAAALIGDPSVLILDEPANGLDPAGIRWMRDLLRDYADPGGTVLLSSHLLTEIEIIADDIVMIGQGRIVSRGSKAELLAAAGTVVRAADVASTAGTPARRTPACSRAGWPDGTSPESSGRKPSATGPITRPALRPEPPSVHGVGIVWRAPRLPTQISAPCVRAGPGSATGRVPSKCDATPS
jgi:ABC-2 type transport system ATP-binding protein